MLQESRVNALVDLSEVGGGVGCLEKDNLVRTNESSYVKDVHEYRAFANEDGPDFRGDAWVELTQVTRLIARVDDSGCQILAPSYEKSTYV
jgi:hypothetical protein